MAEGRKEPGTFSGTIFADIMPVPNKGTAMLAARLCNFWTDYSALLPSHQNWLDANAQPLLRMLPSPWVDLIGYASQLGTAGHNYSLSAQRCDKVRDWISNYSNNVKFNVQWPKGASESATIPTNNDGWWRAVEVYVYGYRPPTVTPLTIVGSRRFKIRSVGAGSAGVSKYGVGPNIGGAAFEIVDRENNEVALFVHGAGSLGVGLGPSVSFSDTGSWTEFGTSARVELPDFEGAATIYQDPGMQLNTWSVGGTTRLAIDSSRLLRLGARITPHAILPINTGSGYSGPSISFGLPGPFRMVGTTRPYP